MKFQHGLISTRLYVTVPLFPIILSHFIDNPSSILKMLFIISQAKKITLVYGNGCDKKNLHPGDRNLFFFIDFPEIFSFFTLVSFAFFVFFVFTCLSQKSLGKSSFHSSSANDSKFITYYLPFLLNHVFFVPSFIIFCFFCCSNFFIFYFSIYSILHILLQFTPIYTNMLLQHCVKGVRIRSYSSPYFPACGLNTERDSVSLRVQCECRKVRTRITLNTDTFHTVQSSPLFLLYC